MSASSQTSQFPPAPPLVPQTESLARPAAEGWIRASARPTRKQEGIAAKQTGSQPHGTTWTSLSITQPKKKANSTHRRPLSTKFGAGKTTHAVAGSWE